MFTEEQQFFFNTPLYHTVWSAQLRQCAFMLGSVAHLAVYKLLMKCRCTGEDPPSTDEPWIGMCRGAVASSSQKLLAGIVERVVLLFFIFLLTLFFFFVKWFIGSLCMNLKMCIIPGHKISLFAGTWVVSVGAGFGCSGCLVCTEVISRVNFLCMHYLPHLSLDTQRIGNFDRCLAADWFQMTRADRYQSLSLLLLLLPKAGIYLTASSQDATTLSCFTKVA